MEFRKKYTFMAMRTNVGLQHGRLVLEVVLESQHLEKAVEKRNLINQWHFCAFCNCEAGPWCLTTFGGFEAISRWTFFFSMEPDTDYQDSKLSKNTFPKILAIFLQVCQMFGQFFFFGKFRDTEIGWYKSIDRIDLYVFRWFSEFLQGHQKCP